MSGCWVDDADVEVVDDHEYWGVGVAAADADVVEFAVVAQGDFAAGVDVVVADTVLGAGFGGGCGFGELGVDVCGYCACDAAVGVGARNRVVACQAACLYSLMRPSQRVTRTSRRGNGWSVVLLSGVVCRGGRWASERWGRWVL